jgi:hypothetical protein
MDAIQVNHLKRIFKTTTGVFKRKEKEVLAVEDWLIFCLYWEKRLPLDLFFYSSDSRSSVFLKRRQNGRAPWNYSK